MCKFLKQKTDGKKRKASPLSANVFALNIVLCALVCGVVGAYAFLAVGNTSKELAIGERQRELGERLNQTSMLAMSLNEQESGLLNSEVFEKLKLVKAGAVEYAKGVGGEVAIR